MEKVRCITKKLGTGKDDLLIKRILDAYKELDKETPMDYSSPEWELDDIVDLKDYKVLVLINKVKPILAIDVMPRFSKSPRRAKLFDLTEICEMEFDDRANVATVISLGYLIDSVLDEYEEEFKK